ncbi:DUF58 domain-containing protein [Candidatus Woesearchaeota archaeon]|nr:DUF58 domain-containing protein [Candidatus Woesearchaeota archaeon]
MAIDISFLRQLDRFDVVLKKRVLSNYTGSRQSRNFGSGLVFYDYKDYVPGDDFRAIDWKVWGRTNEFFVRRYEEERNMRIHVVIDASASMDFGTRYKKFEYAAMIGLGFCYMALRNNESFEVSTFSEDLEVFRAEKGASKLMSVVERLNAVKPRGHSNFRLSLEKYKSAIKTKSMVILISDFLFDPEELKNTLFRYKKSEVLIVQVLDSSERELDLHGDVILDDSETKDRMRTYISNKVIENYSEQLLEHIYNIKRVCDGFGAKFLSISTETPVFDAFYSLLGKDDRVIM